MATQNINVTDKNSDLYKILEMVEGHLDSFRSEKDDLLKRLDDGDKTVADAITRVDSASSSWEEIKTRLDNMDKALAKGDKRYIPAGGERTANDNKETRERFARWLINGMSVESGMGVRFGDDGDLERFKRATNFDGNVPNDVGQNVTADSEGGYLVPDEFRQEIIRIQETYGFCRQNFRNIPVMREVLHMPTHVSGPAVEWVDEGEGVQAEGPATFGRLTLTTKRLMALDTLSLEIQAWSIPVITNFLLDVFGEKIAQEEDRVGLTGDATANPTADPFNGVMTDAGNTVIMGGSSSSGSDNFSAISYEDLVDLMDAPNEFVANRGVFVMSNYMVNQIRKIREGAGTGLPMWVDMASGRPGTILGRPYIVTASMPKAGDSAADTNAVLYGDFSRAFLADSWNLRVDFSSHADFKRGNIVMRLLERVGFKVAIADAFAVLKTSTT